MLFNKTSLNNILLQLDDILNRILEFETQHEHLIQKVHPNYTQSARNLIHYLAIRTFDNNALQKALIENNLPNTASSESHILQSILSLKAIIHSLLKQPEFDIDHNFVEPKEAIKLLSKHSNAIFGKPNKKRHTRIMVTQPTTASEDPQFVKALLDNGMDCARINCAHDDPNVWQAIIEHIKSYDKSCKIMMDLGGPKLRTGQMKPGPKVIHIKPKRNALGQVVSPAKVWLAPYGILPETQEQIDAIIPVNKKWLKKTKQGSYISFNDARDKKCKLFIETEEGMGRWANCSDSAFITMDTLLYVHLEKKSTSEIHTVQELLPLEEIIYLFEGDYLRIDKAPILGEPAVLDEQGQIIEMAHISCTLPDVFDFVKTGESVFFDDGKIGGIIAEVLDDHLLVKITETKKNGGKLKAEKGINFPDSNIQISGLTQKDKEDLKFVAQHADSVNFSFVTSKSDVAALLEAMASLEASLGIILKIETLEAYKNLPNILLKAMEHYPVGVMIARGDLAIETGWKNFAVIQEELLRMCKATHIPTVWATQVLENLAKKGVPTRSEITDAALAQRSECVMLNKGYFITKAVKMLEKVLREIQHIQHKEKKLYPKLKFHPIS